MRLFVAIEFDGIKEYLISLQEKLKEQDAKMTFPKSFHLTMKFLGDVDDKKADEIKEALKEVKFEPFKLKIKDMGVFPTETYIRVVWIGLEDGKPIEAIQKQVEELMEKAGFKREKRDFVSHITLARVKFIENDKKKEFSEFVKKIKIEEKEVEVKSFKLIKSELTPEGPVYEDVEEFK